MSDNNKYWLITYSWKSGSNRVLAYDTHQGPVAEWVKKSLLELEDYILLNQVEIDENQFFALTELM